MVHRNIWSKHMADFISYYMMVTLKIISRSFYPHLILVQPRKRGNRPDLTEKMLTRMLNTKTHEKDRLSECDGEGACCLTVLYVCSCCRA